MELFVQYESRCVDSYREEREYGDWSETWDFAVKGVCATSRGRWAGLAYDEDKLNVGFEAEPGDPVHVLWMTFGTGDSFGHSDGHGEILWVFKNAEVARRALTQWQDNEEQYSITIKDETGREIELTNPGSGYFESINSLQVTTFVLSV
jgi:hypothetical protein